MFGFLNLYKPRNLSSRTVTSSIYQVVRPTKVGHTGTLDPLASGVLVNAIGPATRLSRYVQDARKLYCGSFRLGFTSDTEDITGEVQPVTAAPEISRAELVATLDRFRGSISQVPPQFSALKVDGVRAYKLARRGEGVELKPRSVEIYGLELKEFSYPDFELEIECSGGTYVRSLGRDIGRALGSDAIMVSLERTGVGNFTAAAATRPENLTLEIIQRKLVLPQNALPQLTQVKIDLDVVRQLENAIPWRARPEVNASEILAIDPDDRLIAVMKRRDSGEYTPAINFANYWKELG